MTWVDLVVFAILAVSGLLAFVRGIVREVLGLAAWVGAFATAVVAMPAMRMIVARWIDSPGWAEWVSYAVVFLLALIVLMLIARAIGRLVRGSALGGVDRTLGLLFGLGRGAVVVMIAYMLGRLAVPIDQWPAAARDARTLTPTDMVFRWVAEQIPTVYRPRIGAPPVGREAMADDLLRARPQGRAVGRPPIRN